MTSDELKHLPNEVGKMIPDGEKIYWSGMPNWRSFGYHAFGIKYLIFYLIFCAFYSVTQINGGFNFSTFFGKYLPFIISGLFAGMMLFFLAYVAASHTCYVLTEKRIVIKTGVALVFLLNLPLKNVVSIDKKTLAQGRGNLSFKAQSKKRIPFLSCWPSVRGGSFFEPIPTFRSIANIDYIGTLVGEVAEKNRKQKKITAKPVGSGVAA